jgi:hypothetical protein
MWLPGLQHRFLAVLAYVAFVQQCAARGNQKNGARMPGQSTIGRVAFSVSLKAHLPFRFTQTRDARALYGKRRLLSWLKTLRKHFREELSSGKFKIDMLAGKTVTELMESRDERVRLDAAKYYTACRMGWKETNFNEQGPSPSTGRANGAGLPKTRKRGKLANEPAAIW